MFKQSMQDKNGDFIVITPNEDGKLGIENLKIVFTILIGFWTNLLRALKSKAWGAIFEVVYSLLRYGDIITIAIEAWEELKDLSQAETEEMNAHFAQEFDLENDQIEALIEEAVATIPRIYELGENVVNIVWNARIILDDLKVIFGWKEEPEETAAKA